MIINYINIAQFEMCLALISEYVREKYGWNECEYYIKYVFAFDEPDKALGTSPEDLQGTYATFTLEKISYSKNNTELQQHIVVVVLSKKVVIEITPELVPNFFEALKQM